MPPQRVLVTVASLVTAIALVRFGLLERVFGAIVDRAVVNIVTLILGFSACVSLLAWFLRESGHPPRLKRAVGFGLLAAVATAVAVLRIEGVSGDLVPRLVFRWSRSRDRLLPRPDRPQDDGGRSPAAAPSGVAWEPTPRDFPRFLGPAGTAALDEPRIDPDWGLRPPVLAWRRPIGAGWGGFAVVGDRAVTLEQRGDEEVVSCHDLPTGRPVWQVAVTGRHQTVLGGTGPRSTPTIHEGVVYTTGATGWLHAIDGASGEVVWRINVIDDLKLDPAAHAAAVAWGRAGSPLVAHGLVVVPGGGPLLNGGGARSLVAYDRTDGSRRWTAGDAQISYCSPVLADVAGREAIVSINEAQVAAYDPADGTELWSFDWPGHSNSDASCSQPQLIDGRRIFLSKGYGIGAALFEATASGGTSGPASPPSFARVWARPNLLKTKFTTAVVHDGHAYGLSDGILECVRLADGARAWKGGRYGQGQVLRVGTMLLVQAEGGDVVLVDCTPEKHRVRGRLAALDGQTWNNPCVTRGHLLVRNAEEAACYRFAA